MSKSKIVKTRILHDKWITHIKIEFWFIFCIFSKSMFFKLSLDTWSVFMYLKCLKLCSCILSVLKHNEDWHFKIPDVKTWASREVGQPLRARWRVSQIFVSGLNIKDTSRVSIEYHLECLTVSAGVHQWRQGMPADAEHRLTTSAFIDASGLSGMDLPQVLSTHWQKNEEENLTFYMYTSILKVSS